MQAAAGAAAVVESCLVEPDLRDIVPGYIKKRKIEVSSCYLALEQGNLASVQAMGHKMKGTGAGYGFPFLSETGSRIEMAARDGHTAELKALIDGLASYLDRIEIENSAQ